MGERIVARTADLEWRRVEGEIVILDLRSQQFLSLNRSGARLWPLLAAGTSRRGLVDELVANYGVEQARATDDVDRLLGQLTAADLLDDPVEPGPEHARER